MPVPWRYWGIGIAAAVLVHAAIAALVLWQPAAPGAREAGLRGIEVALGPAGGAPGDAAQATDAPEATDSPVDTVPDATPRETDARPPEQVATRPVEETVTARPETTGVRPVEKEPVEEEEIEAVEEEEVAAAPEPDPARAEQSTAPVPEAAPTREPDETTAEPVPEEAPAEKTGLTTAGAGGESGSRAAAGAGSGQDRSRGGDPGASADYMAQLRAWLEKHKRYPRRARTRRQEGTAVLRFVVDREGRVLEYEIRESSGHDILDREVTAMIERAQPLPGMPDDMGRGRLELVVPVQFRLM